MIDAISQHTQNIKTTTIKDRFDERFTIYSRDERKSEAFR